MLGIEQSKPKWETKEALRETLTKAKARWGEISERLRRQLVPSSEIERRLKVVNAPSCPNDIGVDNDFIERNILFAMFMRNRYNALDFAYRIGKLHEFAAKACAPWKTEK
jgi:glycerol-1-phosphate dehydrogenase [NAD(P)+]